MKIPRSADIWLPGYCRSRLHSAIRSERLRHVWLTIADHYEPLAGGRASIGDAIDCVTTWRRQWPEISGRHEDSTGASPVYTFFYPQEDYRPELLEPLAEMSRAGVADVDIHIHHDGEGQADFEDRMQRFKTELRSHHGLLREVNGKVVFGFIHGNWALDNSRPDGRYCGLNNEISLLRDLGCYADFTLPSVPWPTQTRIVNTIYWAIDDPEKPKSHDSGIALKPGKSGTGDLLMIPGPLGLRFRRRLIPRVEVGEIAGYDMPSPDRVRTWLSVAPRIGDQAFIKLHTHGAQQRNMQPLLNGGLDSLFTGLKEECARAGLALHYVSAWDMARAVLRAASVEDHTHPRTK